MLAPAGDGAPEGAAVPALSREERGGQSAGVHQVQGPGGRQGHRHVGAVRRPRLVHVCAACAVFWIVPATVDSLHVRAGYLVLTVQASTRLLIHSN